jgi:hypothetical protein
VGALEVMSNAGWWVICIFLIVVVSYLATILHGVKLILKKLDKMSEK